MVPGRGKASLAGGFDKRLKAALAERDDALRELARARETINALRLSERHRDDASTGYPVSAGLGPTPLRYVMADRANDVAKSLLGPLHRALKTLTTREK